MCFDRDARPPALPSGCAVPALAGGAAAESLELTSADGTRFSAALASSGREGGAGVVILPDVRGLYRFYAELAERFAEAGHHAIALDYFGRTAGTGERGDDFEAMPHVLRTTVDQIQADLRAARDALIARTGERPVVVVGFCFGGRQGYFAAMEPGLGLAGVVSFYGSIESTRVPMPSPIERAGEVSVPLLGLFGGADQGIPPEQVDAFDQALTRAGAEHEFVVYPGAPHSFFDRKATEYAQASEDAWRRVLAFLAVRS